MSSHLTAQALLERSNRLGSDIRNTNYAGGNTSAKGNGIDPVTQEPVELLWVKGSGGDLGTLEETGLSVMRLDRLRSLVDTYKGVEHEDDMVQAFSFCMHGQGGAVPSIDTAMHGLVMFDHVDHLHPDSGIAIATSRDGKALTLECFGDDVVWVPWRRPGFQLGLDIRDIQRANPQAIGCILGGHGITAWGKTSEECEANSLRIIRGAEEFIAQHGRVDPFGPMVVENQPLPVIERRRRAAQLAPAIRGMASTDRRMIGHFDDSAVVLDFLSRTEHPRLAELGTSCPDHFLRTKVRPMVLDLPPTASLDQTIQRLQQLHHEYRCDYEAYYQRYATSDSPPMRGGDPAIVLVPGIGMFSFGANKQTARVAGEFYINAINVMRGAEALSTYSPIDEEEKFRIEYWVLEEAKLQRLPKPKRLAGRIAIVTGGASGIGLATAGALVSEGACVVIADLNQESAASVAEDLGGSDAAVGIAVDVSSEEAVTTLIENSCLAFGGVDLVVNNAGLSLSRSLLETTTDDWDLQYSVMARGSFLVSREASRAMIAQGMGGDIVYVVSKNAIFSGPSNIAYSSTKASQAHQVRLLAAELGEYGIRVNGVNPDGVVQGSGIFSSGWGASRAAVYGVNEEDLGQFYANRTILKQEVLPEHVAQAVATLCTSELSRTTGLLIPVDSGVAAAFLR
jgi:rhamnulose-1-phosphate aldolase/alcohol dehydrogenase